jgi:hypothetical protein
MSGAGMAPKHKAICGHGGTPANTINHYVHTNLRAVTDLCIDVMENGVGRDYDGSGLSLIA